MTLLFLTPWTEDYQAPLSVGFSRQEYCSGLQFPSPRDTADPETEPTFPALQMDCLPLSHLGSPRLHVVNIKIRHMIYGKTNIDLKRRERNRARKKEENAS